MRDDVAGSYAAAILARAPRVLGALDRERASPTSGCGDRTYWAWKFVDFPRARFQEAVCVLAFLHATPLDGSPYHGSARLLEWIGYGLDFWCSLQHGDGSFDEAYPYERSLAATAFTSFYVAEALEWLGPALDAPRRGRVVEALRRAAGWLVRNDESHGVLSNHLAAAAAAAAHAFRLTGDDAFRQRRDHFLGRILRHQSSEGWYEEYGGADPGYQTHGSFYLARCLELEPDAALADSLRRANAFLACMVHPDGSLGGETASRNTQTYYPAAFEMLAPHDPAAAWIAETLRPSLSDASAAALSGIDAYNFYPCLNNLVFAWRAAAAAPGPPRAEAPRADEALLWFPEAGIARVRRPRYEAFVGASKGGVLKVFDRRARRLVYSDCGYVGRLHSGRLVSTQQLDRTRPVRVAPDAIEVEGGLHEVTRPTLHPHTFAAFRLFSISVGRAAGVARWLKRLLVRVLVSPRKALPARFVRRIELADDAITVRDRLQAPRSTGVASLSFEESFTTIHMGSSRYFVAHELLERRADDGREIGADELAAGAERVRRVAFGA